LHKTIINWIKEKDVYFLLTTKRRQHNQLSESTGLTDEVCCFRDTLTD